MLLSKNMTKVPIADLCSELGKAAKLGDEDRQHGFKERSRRDVALTLNLDVIPLQETALYHAYCIGFQHETILRANHDAIGP